MRAAVPCLLWGLVAVVWLGLTIPAAAQTGTVALQRIDVTALPEVTVYFTVTAPDGRAVLGLTPAEVRITLDDTAQPLPTIQSALEGGETLAVALLFDRSGSMTTGLGPAREAALDFVTRLSQGDRAAVVSFDDTVAVEQDLTDDRTALTAAIAAVQGGRDTALFDAVLTGLSVLEPAGTGRRAVIVLSDGKDTRSQAGLADAVERARTLGVAVYVLGLPVDTDRETLDRLAGETGGTYLQADSPEDLRRLYQLIAEQLQNQYVARFVSTFGRDEAWHRLSIAYGTGAGPTASVDREFLSSTGPGIARDRRQGLARELVQADLLTAAGLGAGIGLVVGALLLFVVRLARPLTPLLSARGVGVLLTATALGATAGPLVLLWNGVG